MKGLIKSTLVFFRMLEFIGGSVTGLLGLFLFLKIIRQALSLGDLTLPLDLWILAMPGIIVATGSYFQAIRGNRWGVLVVVVSGIANLFLVGSNGKLVYLLAQHPWSQIAIFANSVVTLLTIGLGLLNAVLMMTLQRVGKVRP